MKLEQVFNMLMIGFIDLPKNLLNSINVNTATYSAYCLLTLKVH